MSDDLDLNGVSSSAESEPTMDAPARLWTPWRMHYIAGDQRRDGCVFCDRLAADDDVHGLILYRGIDAFIIMNLYPYNTGHVMLVPNEHISSPELAPESATRELADLRGPVLRAIRRGLGCHAFNIGLNVGPEAGAGIAEHMHEHVVPRWNGDANFMPIIAGTKVLPELLPTTYARVRAELMRELRGTSRAAALVVDRDRSAVLLDSERRLVQTELTAGVSAWRSVFTALGAATAGALALAGWGGSQRASDHEIVLAVEVDEEPGSSRENGRLGWVPLDEALSGPDGPLIQAGLGNLGPST